MNEVIDRLFVAVVLRDRLIDASCLEDVFRCLNERRGNRAALCLVSGGWLTSEDKALVEEIITQRLHELANRLVQSSDDASAYNHWQKWIEALAGNDTVGRADFAGRYEICELQGEGGRGRVWRARDAAIGRMVAVKELKAEALAASDARARFVEEARVTGQLEHPCIVPVYELHESGSVYYTMRLISGQTMEEVIADLHLDANFSQARLWRLLESFLDVCAAVGFAHTRGVVHRDLKPANIVMGSFGEVCVLDWGMAKRLGQNEVMSQLELAEPGVEQTGTGRVKGTPRYMAPEQAAGLSDRIDGRTDVYALGAILFTVLTGQSPHDRFKNCGRDEYLQKISSGGLPRAREVRADAPLALDAVCAKAMATEPDDRYGTALDLANDVRQWLRGEPTSAYREPWLQRLRRKAAHHRRLTVTGAAALLTLVVAYTAFSVQSWAETNTLVELTMRDLSTRSDMLRNDILIHLRHLQITCKSTSQDPLVQDFVQKDAQAANPGPQGQRVESLFTTYLQLVVLCRSLSIADGSADGQEVLRVLRHGSGDPAHTALPAELRKLGRMSDYRWLFEAGGGSSYRARFCRGDSGDPGMILVIATAIDQPGQRYWLIVEYDYTTWLTLLLDPFANHRIEAFVRDEAGQLLVAAGTLHADCLFGDRRASGDARLVQFLSTPGPVGPAAPDGPDQFLQGVPPTDPRNILALPDCGAHRDLVFASKIHYSKDDPKAYLGLILLKHPDDFLEYRRASSLVLFGSWLLIFAAVMVMVVIAARLFTRREPWQS